MYHTQMFVHVYPFNKDRSCVEAAYMSGSIQGSDFNCVDWIDVKFTEKEILETVLCTCICKTSEQPS